MKKELVEKTKERTNPYKSVTDHQKFRLILILILKNDAHILKSTRPKRPPLIKVYKSSLFTRPTPVFSPNIKDFATSRSFSKIRPNPNSPKDNIET